VAYREPGTRLFILSNPHATKLSPFFPILSTTTHEQIISKLTRKEKDKRKRENLAVYRFILYRYLTAPRGNEKRGTL
jgi:hypothetical protein